MTRRFVWLAFTLAVASVSSTPTLAQEPSPRFWLAGRYDGNHIVVFFDAVKFAGTVPPTARTLSIPAALGFLFQKELPASYASQLPRKPDAERFHIGEQYDLRMGDGKITTVTLTTVVGYVSDDEDDNPSYIGALAEVDEPTDLLGGQNYYALQRHDSERSTARKPGSTSASISLDPGSVTFSSLFDEPVRLDMQIRIAELLTSRMRKMATAEQLGRANNLSPTLAVQSFRLADGNFCYYARAEWRSDDEAEGLPAFALGAWIASGPELRILAVEEITSPYGFIDELPNLLNVVDLGAGRTGIIATIMGPGDSTLGLWEYHDGADLSHMKLFESLVTDE